MLQKVRILIGVYGNFNRKAHLLELNAVAKKYAIKLQVHISRNRNFHWKYYHFQHPSNQAVYVGSANFTSGGLQSNGELLVKLTDVSHVKNRSLIRLTKEFDKEWEASGAIAEFDISKYKEAFLPRPTSTKQTSENAAFFEKRKKITEVLNIASEKSMLVYLKYNVSKRTEKMIANVNPDWADVEYFVCNTGRIFEQCCAIRRYLILEKEGRDQISASWAQYRDDLKLQTPDGKYFIAYDQVGRTKKLTGRMLDELTDTRGPWKLKLRGRKNLLSFKMVGKNQVKNIRGLLKFETKA